MVLMMMMILSDMIEKDDVTQPPGVLSLFQGCQTGVSQIFTSVTDLTHLSLMPKPSMGPSGV